jgi:hypothetical protein
MPCQRDTQKTCVLGDAEKGRDMRFGQLPLLQGADQTGLSAGVTLPAEQTPHHEQSTNPSASNMDSSHPGKQSVMDSW